MQNATVRRRTDTLEIPQSLGRPSRKHRAGHRNRRQRKQGEFYLQRKSIGIATAAKLPNAPLSPVASIGHGDDRSVFTCPCIHSVEKEQDECCWCEHLHLFHSASEGDLVYGQGTYILSSQLGFPHQFVKSL